jgi:ATP-dependent Lon protease
LEPALRDKIQGAFGEHAVDKREALQAGFELMPRFVTEFLLARAREKRGSISVTEVRDRIHDHSVDAGRRGAFLSGLMREGRAQAIALLDVEPRPQQNQHVARIAQLDAQDFAISDVLVERFPELLYGGLWGSVSLRYEPSGTTARISVEDFTPYQVTRPDVDLLRRARREFTLDEWLDLLVTSAGYRPEAFGGLRHKLLLLSRLVPLTQSNVNLVELGPRGTGKSYLLRSLTSRAYLLAGARATPASLLYDLRLNQIGIVGRKKALVFDEIGATSFPDRSLVAALKDYMESGQIARGGRALVSDCSFLLTGNLDLGPDGKSPSREYIHLFEEFPAALRDTAIVDRIHGFIPGWELPKIRDDVLADGVGLLSDYFGEVLCELRRDVRFLELAKAQVHLEDATIRDKTAVERITAGLLRMLYPDRNVAENELPEVVQVAVELRQRVHQQLERMAPGEYRAKTLRFPGMGPTIAPDLIRARSLQDADVEANHKSLVGKITILTVSPIGGGDVGFVECAHVDGLGLSVTGLHGVVLEHSVRAAYDALLFQGRDFGLAPERLRDGKMSVHLVNIASPKDGPSAGLAFGIAMLSAATGRRVAKGLALTGELSLQGNVLAIGGLPEKLAAAMTHGRKTVIIPAQNADELAQLPEAVAALDIRPVRTLAEAVAIAFEPVQGAVAAAVPPAAAVLEPPSHRDELVVALSEDLSPSEIPDLASAVRLHFEEIRKAAAERPYLPVELAAQLADGLERVLGSYASLDGQGRRAVVAAARYFVATEDAADDLQSPQGGLDDDLAVFNEVMTRIGREDLAIRE